MVSVCIATYNGEKYIIKQVQSILNQLGAEDEIIISDDGSADNTLNLVKKLRDDRIKIINGPCKGYIQNFANAISHASGDYIFLSDQDDEWYMNKIEIVLPFLQKFKMVMHNARFVDGDDNYLGEMLFKDSISFSFWKNIIKHQTYGCCLSFSSDLKSYILPIPYNKHLLHETWISGLCQLIYGNKSLCYLNMPLINYRRHGDNVSLLHSNRSYYIRIVERFVLLYHIIVRYIKCMIKRFYNKVF